MAKTVRKPALFWISWWYLDSKSKCYSSGRTIPFDCMAKAARITSWGGHSVDLTRLSPGGVDAKRGFWTTTEDNRIGEGEQQKSHTPAVAQAT